MIREKLAEFTPPWLQGFHAFRYLYTMALVADATIEQALQAISARFPGYGTETALDRIARDRKIHRGPFESNEHFAARLALWLDDQEGHRVRGNAEAMLRQVQGWCGPYTPRVRLIIPNKAVGFVAWWTLETDGTLTKQVLANPTAEFDWDGATGLDSRAWLVIYNTAPNQLWADDGVWVEGATSELWEEETIYTWGSQAADAHVRSLVDLVRDWKSAASFYVEILVAFDDALFDPLDGAPPNPDGTWGYYGVTPGGPSYNIGDMVAARSNDAVYWLGTG